MKNQNIGENAQRFAAHLPFRTIVFSATCPFMGRGSKKSFCNWGSPQEVRRVERSWIASLNADLIVNCLGAGASQVYEDIGPLHVDCLGFGGAGVTLSWGAAIRVLNLVNRAFPSDDAECNSSILVKLITLLSK
jgi:hypothetical protein